MRLSLARLTGIVGAWGLLTIWTVVYDDILYPLAIFKWGPLVGGGCMAIIAILICVGQLLWYEKTKRDWLGADEVEQIKERGHAWVKNLDAWLRGDVSKGGFMRRVRFLIRLIGWSFLFLPSRAFLVTLWALKTNDFCAFVALSITQDPFVTTVFLRHGRFDGLRKKDWAIFMASALLCNAYWIARSTLLVEIVKTVWSRIVGND